MMVAVRMSCRLPALVLCAVLMMSAETVRAGDAPVAPFPGTSGLGTSGPGALEGGGGSSAESAPLPALGADGAGLAAGTSAPGAAPEASSEAAPDAEAEGQSVAAPAVDARPSDAAVPDGNLAAENPATPVGGSRLLRALAEATTPNRAAVGGPAAGAAGAAPLHAAEGCPRALLRRLLAGAVGEADALSALGIEQEILTLCRERQEIVAGLFETEARLRELRAAPVPVPADPAATAVQTPTPAPAARESAAAGAAEALPLRLALADAAQQANEADPGVGDTRAGEPRAADTRAAEPQGNSLVQAPHYAWFSIIGTAGALRAGITDGSDVWFVREGDGLPGGATITAIAGRPPAVRVTGAGENGEAILLPFRTRPGDAP